MKKQILFFAAVSICLAACSKKELNEPQTPAEPGTFCIRASIPQTKTTLTGYKVAWEPDDALSVIVKNADETYSPYQFKNDGAGIFSSDALVSAEGISELNAIYPYNDGITSLENAFVTISAEATQTEAGNTAHIDGPLYGHAAVSGTGTQEVMMSHLSTIFEIQIPNTSGSPLTVSEITLASSTEAAMAGDFLVDMQSGALTAQEGASAQVVLKVADGAIEPGQTGSFYITAAPFTLPAGSTLTATVNTGAEQPIVTEKYFKSSVVFAAGTINHFLNTEEMEFAVTPDQVSGIDGYDSNFADGDAINIFDSRLSNKFEYASGNFSGSAMPSASYYALYPYDENAVLDNGVIKTEIQAVQSGKLGDLTAAGYSEGNEIAMKNVTGILKFTLEEDNVTKVTITAADGQILAGAVNIAWNEGNPVVTAAAEGSSSSVAVGDGTAVLEKGVYYVNVLPADLSEYTLTFTYREDTSTYSGYFDKWYPGETKADASGRQTITRGVCELPLARTSSASLAAGTQVDLGEMSATLVYYDDAVPATINGVKLDAAFWDTKYLNASCTDDPYSGTNCIQWGRSATWGELIFQTWYDPDEYARGALDLTPYRNAHFTLEFAYKAEPGTTFFVRFMQHIAGYENLRVVKDISEYSTGEWEVVRVPLDEMIVSDYAMDLGEGDSSYGKIEVDDDAFDMEGNPFRWDKVLRLIFTPVLDRQDTSMDGKIAYFDDIKIKKVILSDQAAE